MTNLHYKLFIIGNVPRGATEEFEKCMNTLTRNIDRDQFRFVIYVDGGDDTLDATVNWAKGEELSSVSRTKLTPHVDFHTAIIFWDGADDISSKRNMLASTEYRLVRTDKWC
jgi:hypothetical protein